MERKLDAAAEVVKNNIIDEFGGPRRGRFYSGAQTRSSAPGEAPAVQTGNLVRSIASDKPRALTRDVGTNVKYGVYLEFGTRKMAPRPFLKPALKKSLRAIKGIFRK
jgi:HK97 gp10 family phage protein